MKIQIYPPAVFDVYNKEELSYDSSINEACDTIYKACKGLGTDESALIDVLGPKSVNERNLIVYRYKELYDENLKDMLKGEAGGEFGYLLQLVVMSLPEAEAFILHRACQGAGTDEHSIYPVLLGRSNEEMKILKGVYFDSYGKDLAVLMDSELGGDFKKVIMAALQSPMVDFDPSYHTKSKAEEDAEKLYGAGQGKWGTDEESFIAVLVSSPPEYLKLMDEAYTEKYGNSIKVAIEKEFGSDAKKALVHFVRLALEPIEYLTELIESAMKGFGTDEMGLAAGLVRFHQFMPQIMEAYHEQYGVSLKDRIHGETSGDFRKLAIAVLEAPSS